MVGQRERTRQNSRRQTAAASAFLRDQGGQYQQAARQLIKETLLPHLRGEARPAVAVRTEMVMEPYPCYLRYDFGHVHINCRTRDVLTFIATHKDLRQYDCRIAPTEFMGFVLTIRHRRR